MAAEKSAARPSPRRTSTSLTSRLWFRTYVPRWKASATVSFPPSCRMNMGVPMAARFVPMTGYREVRGPATPPYSLQDGLYITHRANRESWDIFQKQPCFHPRQAGKNYATFTFGYTKCSGEPLELRSLFGAHGARDQPPICESVSAHGRRWIGGVMSSKDSRRPGAHVRPCEPPKFC